MATITLQLGNYSNYVASHIWNLHDSMLSEDVSQQNDVEDYATSNLYKVVEKSNGQQKQTPRTVILDLRENMVGLDTDTEVARSESLPQSIWGGAVKTVERPESKHSKPDWNPSTSAPSVKYWSDILENPFHAKSCCEMPLWTNKNNFDTFFSGQSLELVPPDLREDLMDRVRYFAEECDNLQCLRVFADLHDGFAAVACSAVEDLKDEYPSVAMPVWAFTDPSTHENESDHLAPSTNTALRSLGVPLSYLKLCENASVVIPIGSLEAAQQMSRFIHLSGTEHYESSAAYALAIETAEGYRHLGVERNESIMGPKDWCNAATKNGRFPFCSLEAGVNPLGDKSLDPLMDTFQNGMPLTNLNPFLHSLSASSYGAWAVRPNTHIRTGRAYSNLLSVRGPCTSDLTEMLYSKCLMTSYLLSACFQRITPLLPHYSFPSFFDGLSFDGITNCPSEAFLSSPYSIDRKTGNPTTFVERCSFMAAVGCDSRMGQHIGLVAETWRRRPESCRAQLEKMGIGSDEYQEVLEGLTNIKFRYEPSTDM